MEEVLRDREQGREVLIGGDFNEADEKGSKMTQQLEEAGLVNVIGRRVDKIPPTRTPGKRAIDHMWTTNGLDRRIRRI